MKLLICLILSVWSVQSLKSMAKLQDGHYSVYLYHSNFNTYENGSLEVQANITIEVSFRAGIKDNTIVGSLRNIQIATKENGTLTMDTLQETYGTALKTKTFKAVLDGDGIIRQIWTEPEENPEGLEVRKQILSSLFQNVTEIHDFLEGKGVIRAEECQEVKLIDHLPSLYTFETSIIPGCLNLTDSGLDETRSKAWYTLDKTDEKLKCTTHVSYSTSEDSVFEETTSLNFLRFEPFADESKLTKGHGVS